MVIHNFGQISDRNVFNSFFSSSKVVLFTNLNSPFVDDKIEVIANSFKNNDINFVFVGPEFEDEDDEDDGRHGVSQPLNQQQALGARCMRHILEQVRQTKSADSIRIYT